MRHALCLALTLWQGAAWAAPLGKPDKISPLHQGTVSADTAALSADGQTLAFVRFEPGPKAKRTLVVLDLSSLKSREVPLSVSPDGLRLDGVGKVVWFLAGKDLYRFALADKEPKKWRSLEEDVESLAVSPQGQVYVTMKVSVSGKGLPRGAAAAQVTKVCRVAEKGKPKPLTSDYVSDATLPRFTGRGDLLLDARFPDAQGRLEEREIVLLTPRGKRTRLTQLHGNCYDPGASADGRQIVFACTQGTGDKTWERLNLLDAKTRKLSTLLDDHGFSAYGAPSFAPDGTALAVAGNKKAWLGYLVSIEGGTPIELASLEETSVLGFALKGKAVVFEAKGRLYLATWK